MNLSDARIILRERSLLECFDLAFPFMRELGPRPYCALGLLTLAPPVVLLALLKYQSGWEWLPTWLLAILLSGAVQGLFTLLAASLLLNERASLRSIVKAFRLRLLPYTLAHSLTRLGIALCTIVPPLVPLAWARYVFVAEVALLEGLSGPSTIDRSSRLVRLDAGRALMVVVLMLSVTCVTVLCAELFGWGIVNFVLGFGDPFGSLLQDGGSLYALIGFFVSVPINATARFLVYIDLRTRRDGWDIQVRFHALRALTQGPQAADGHVQTA